MEIPHNYIPRLYQRPLYNTLSKGFKRGVAVWHRRAGKDKTLINILAKEAVKRRGSYYYFFPTYSQGRKIIWDGMDRDGFPFLGHIPKGLRLRLNSTEMKISLVNGSLIQVVGSDNIDSIVGTNPIGCIFSEFQLQNPIGWDFVRPILRENGGWAFFNYTPRGKNHGWDIYQMALNNPEWFCELLTVDDTKRPDGSPVVTREMVDADRAEGMSEDLVQQEYYCSFEAAVPGAYFATEMREAREQGRITFVPFDPVVKVDTWWDLGIDDSTTIWFSQTCGAEVHFIDYHEAAGEGLKYYAKLLKRKAREGHWVYGRHTAPHDIKVRELGTGKSRFETAKGLGIDFQIAERPQAKEDSIEAARSLFPICWFDAERCANGISALTSYRKDYDEKNRIYRMAPVHDWASHGADAFQTFGIAFSKHPRQSWDHLGWLKH